jgi:hypothetical protein
MAGGRQGRRNQNHGEMETITMKSTTDVEKEGKLKNEIVGNR